MHVFVLLVDYVLELQKSLSYYTIVKFGIITIDTNPK